MNVLPEKAAVILAHHKGRKTAFASLSLEKMNQKFKKLKNCWNQLAVLMFGQLSNRESLRDVALATQVLSQKAFHLGFGKYATKSNLSKANNNRDYRIFEELAYRVIAEARECRVLPGSVCP